MSASPKRRKVDGTMTSAMAEQLVRSLAPEKITSLLVDIVTRVPDALDIVQQELDKDATRRTVVVEGLNANTTVEKIKHVFELYGTIVGCTMSASGERVSCNVEYETAIAATQAVSIPSRFLYGVQVRVSMITPAVHRNGAGGAMASIGPMTAPPGHSLGVGVGLAPERPEERKIFVKGMSWGTTSAMLRAAFEELGQVEAADCVMDRQRDQCKGYGFVTFKTSADARHAVANAPATLDGKPISVFLKEARDGGHNQGQGQGAMGVGYQQQYTPHGQPPGPPRGYPPAHGQGSYAQQPHSQYAPPTNIGAVPCAPVPVAQYLPHQVSSGVQPYPHPSSGTGSQYGPQHSAGGAGGQVSSGVQPYPHPSSGTGSQYGPQHSAGGAGGQAYLQGSSQPYARGVPPQPPIAQSARAGQQVHGNMRKY